MYHNTYFYNCFLQISDPSIDPVLFRIIDRSTLVFDGRLVVDSAFRTNDTNMYDKEYNKL